MTVCAHCHRERRDDQIRDDRLVCKDSAACTRHAATALLAGPTRAQTQAVRMGSRHRSW